MLYFARVVQRVSNDRTPHCHVVVCEVEENVKGEPNLVRT